MIQMYLGGVLVFGVTRRNIEKLTHGQPIFVAVPYCPVEKIAIVFGETKSSIIADMEKLGLDIPQAVKDSVAADPA